MSTATQGRAREHKVRDHLADHGWEPIMRAAASKGPADLLLGCPFRGALLVQVGSKSKTLGPADRERLMHAAELISAVPILAIVTPRQPIKCWRVDRGTPGKWPEWTP